MLTSGSFAFALLTSSQIFIIAKHVAESATIPIEIPAAMTGLNSTIPADKTTAA
ncbi:MAG: hypothetical protein sL5_06320 [Candidatus Mesenet longicola]|uniref:Uncharacterized protein n=1 Tax=Candidatus Mesenet longicola TaxID=1892558 RepID=A0A8J3HV92_9RICK|nr:MAG: hypothetical protein sGL2_06280 [Candidatus Mesenet longicola]GHM59639.1 MAG: hypothetical protein sL5_06320 [Candidatus Mesenet longicola]